MAECIFCRIEAGTIPADLIHDDPDVIAFRDTDPQAPVHVLVVPRAHITSMAALTPHHDALWCRLLRVLQQIARDEGVEGMGYRVVANHGREGGQTIDHLHLHLLGGRAMRWPPG